MPRQHPGEQPSYLAPTLATLIWMWGMPMIFRFLSIISTLILCHSWVQFLLVLRVLINPIRNKTKIIFSFYPNHELGSMATGPRSALPVWPPPSSTRRSARPPAQPGLRRGRRQMLGGPVVPFTPLFFLVLGSLVKKKQPQKRVPLS